MATFLDVTGLEHFSSLFVFLFAWIILYAILASVKIFGEGKVIPILIGLILSIFVLLSPAVTSIVRVLAPWLTVGFLFIVLIAVVSKLIIGDAPGVATLELRGVLLVFLVIVIFIASMSQVRKHISTPGDGGTPEEREFLKPTAIIFHPKIMGAILILAIAVFTIALLTSRVA